MAAGTHKLVIVESPTKARTIGKVLGKGYVVTASMGHVRDLPANAEQIPEAYRKERWARLGVNIEDDFAPLYIVPPDKKKVITELKRALKGATEVYVATDEDREGESIGWHLLEVLKPKVPIHRMVFHEITPEAIRRAIASPRQIDNALVHAQETRRILDRLVGYTVSPVLWKMVKPKLSAGRVQSVAVRLLVLRERERMAFVSGAWWDLQAHIDAESGPFRAALTHLDDVRVAEGRDFDENTGELRDSGRVRLLLQEDAERLAAGFTGAALKVASIERKESKRSPAPPFTTSTLQQEANRKLGMGARTTMQIAQRLYENGLITYMRTDSVNLSSEAVGAARQRITNQYGDDYLSPKPRQYTNRSKGAQEAHEAIRPAGTQMATVSELGLSGAEASLYELIWKRTIATQMAEARIATTTATLQGKGKDGETGTFRASGREVLFPGFFRAYVEGSDDPEGKLEDRNQLLPALTEGQVLQPSTCEARGHQTRPPARYTEASLVKALESEGIGRPSTYASIIDTIQRRGYVMERTKQLIPTFIAMAVTQLLEKVLDTIVDTEFTADMEARLDEVSSSDDALTYLRTFYQRELTDKLGRTDDVDPKEVCTIHSRRLDPLAIRVGRFGPYVEFSDEDGERQTVSLPEDMAPDEVDREALEKLVQQAREADRPLGHHPTSGEPVFLLVGRFGPYLQLGERTDDNDKPKRVSLPKDKSPESVTWEDALGLLSLPRTLGEHPDDQKTVSAGIGRYGPYVLHDKTYASLKPSDDVLAVDLPRAIELLAAKRSGGRRGAEPLRTLGEHPEDGESIGVYEGRFGPYVKHGKINATLPKGSTPETVSLDEALALLTAKAAKAPAKKPARKAAAPKKPPAAKKAATPKKPAAAKKATPRKTTRKATAE